MLDSRHYLPSDRNMNDTASLACWIALEAILAADMGWYSMRLGEAQR